MDIKCTYCLQQHDSRPLLVKWEPTLRKFQKVSSLYQGFKPLLVLPSVLHSYTIDGGHGSNKRAFQPLIKLRLKAKPSRPRKTRSRGFLLSSEFELNGGERSSGDAIRPITREIFRDICYCLLLLLYFILFCVLSFHFAGNWRWDGAEASSEVSEDRWRRGGASGGT
ncbi:hypothetical protein ES332_A06G071000v1 [Gossypium tomentosum]|uniref:Uncharacterized protein n=1 Tax=Gossypium tomentosum TaxID=34277 RepID=A0A5D2Q3E2_GOSTO|nr:hypothetical protein ES332_A06G071000v1 [Gossypium tomentosum]